jgi:hypothetical protein
MQRTEVESIIFVFLDSSVPLTICHVVLLLRLTSSTLESRQKLAHVLSCPLIRALLQLYQNVHICITSIMKYICFTLYKLLWNTLIYFM